MPFTRRLSIARKPHSKTRFSEKIYLLARRRYTSSAIEDIQIWKVSNTAMGMFVQINGKVCLHISPSICTYRHVSPNSLKKQRYLHWHVKTPWLVNKDAFMRQRRRLPKNQTNIAIYEMQILSCSMILSLSPLPFVDSRNNGRE